MGKMIINDMIFVAQIGTLTMSDFLVRRCMWNRTPRAGQFRAWTPLVHSRTDSRRDWCPIGWESLGASGNVCVHGYPCLDHDASWIPMDQDSMIPLLNWINWPLDAT